MKAAEGREQPIVFVIDDDDSLRETLKNLFGMVGLRAETFAKPAEFMNRKLPDVPACIVLDIRLPGMSGLELQTELATADIKIPIIFMTGHGDIPMTVRAMKSRRCRILAQAISRSRHARCRPTRTQTGPDPARSGTGGCAIPQKFREAQLTRTGSDGSRRSGFHE
jgi:DNA-binding response OmpR family regulator